MERLPGSRIVHRAIQLREQQKKVVARVRTETAETAAAKELSRVKQICMRLKVNAETERALRIDLRQNLFTEKGVPFAIDTQKERLYVGENFETLAKRKPIDPGHRILGIAEKNSRAPMKLKALAADWPAGNKPVEHPDVQSLIADKISRWIFAF